MYMRGRDVVQSETKSQPGGLPQTQPTLGRLAMNTVHARSVTSATSDFLQVYELQPARLLCPWDSPGKNTEACPPPGDLPNPGINPWSSTLQADSLPSEPQGKPENTGVGSLSLLQEIFLTQELNRGLQHCRQILYQLSYQDVKSLSCVRLFVTPWTVAYWAPPSMGFFRQEYRSGLPFPSPEDLHNPGIKAGSLSVQAGTLPSKSQVREY